MFQRREKFRTSCSNLKESKLQHINLCCIPCNKSCLNSFRFPLFSWAIYAATTASCKALSTNEFPSSLKWKLTINDKKTETEQMQTSQDPEDNKVKKKMNEINFYGLKNMHLKPETHCLIVIYITNLLLFLTPEAISR